MYTQHFGLTHSPFEAPTDPADAFVGPRQAKVIMRLISALATPDSVVAVSGPVGVGKTTLIDCALESIEGNPVIVRIGRMRLEPDDILDLLVDRFELGEEPKGTVQRVAAVKRQLKKWAEKDRRVFIVVEDALRAGIPALLELESLTAAEASTSPGASIILMGQSEMHNWMSVPDLVRVSQRTRLRQTVEPFNAQEVQGYLTHCLRAAGGDFDAIIRNGTVQVLHSFSGGVARVIRNLCETTFKTAADADLKTIAPQLVGKIATHVYGLRPTAAAIQAMKAAPQVVVRAPRPIAARNTAAQAATIPAAVAPPKPGPRPVTHAEAPAESRKDSQPEVAAAAGPAPDTKPVVEAEARSHSEVLTEPAAAIAPTTPETAAPDSDVAAPDSDVAAPAADVAAPAADVAAPAADAAAAASDVAAPASQVEDPTNPHLQAIIDELPDQEEPEQAIDEVDDVRAVAGQAEQSDSPGDAGHKPVNDLVANDDSAAADDDQERPEKAAAEKSLLPDLDALDAAITAARRELNVPVARTAEDSGIPQLLDDIGAQPNTPKPQKDQSDPELLENLDDVQAETLFGEGALGDISAEIVSDRKAATVDDVKLSLDLAKAAARTGPIRDEQDESYGAVQPESDTASTQPRKILRHKNIPESNQGDRAGVSRENPASLLSHYSKK